MIALKGTSLVGSGPRFRGDDTSPRVIICTTANCLLLTAYCRLPTADCRLFSDFKVRVFLSPYAVVPSVQVVAERAGADEAEAVLLGEVFDADDGDHEEAITDN